MDNSPQVHEIVEPYCFRVSFLSPPPRDSLSEWPPQSSLPWAPPPKEWLSALPVPKGFLPAQTPTITGGKPEASKARASGSLGRALGHLSSPWGAQTATLGRCPTTPVVISHPRTRTMGRIKWTGGDRSLMDGSLPQAAPFADIRSSDPLHLKLNWILTSPKSRKTYWYTSQLP